MFIKDGINENVWMLAFMIGRRNWSHRRNLNWNFFEFSMIIITSLQYILISQINEIITIPKSKNYPNHIKTNSFSLSSAAVLNII